MIGCAADEPAKEETPQEPSSEDATDAGSENEVKPTVGLPAKNFGGEEFTILCRTDKNYEFDWMGDASWEPVEPASEAE